MQDSTNGWLNLSSLGLSIRVLFTGYLLATGLGLLVAGGQILLTHGMADGKFGLSVDDIVYSYYGNRTNSKLENKLNGSMKDKAPTEVRADIIKWVRDGAPKSEWDNRIQSQFQNHCVSCHGVIPGLPDFNRLDSVKQVAKIDEGASIDSLTRVSHIHLFSIGFIFFIVGFIFSFAAGIPTWLKTTVIATPFLFLIVDVFSWWLTKAHPGFAWLTILGGIGYSLASLFMFTTSLYQMWWVPVRDRQRHANAWRDEPVHAAAPPQP